MAEKAARNLQIAPSPDESFMDAEVTLTRHTKLLLKLAEIQDEVEKLDNLVKRVEAGVESSNPEPLRADTEEKIKGMSLASFLNAAPGMLDQIHTRMKTSIESLDSKLF